MCQLSLTIKIVKNLKQVRKNPNLIFLTCSGLNVFFFLRHGKYTRTYFAMYGMQSRERITGRIHILQCMECSLEKGLQVEYIYVSVRHAV